MARQSESTVFSAHRISAPKRTLERMPKRTLNARALGSRVLHARAPHAGATRRGLPSAWKRGRALALALGSLGMGVLLWPLRYASRADQLDGWWLRARFGWKHGQQAPPSTSPGVSPSTSPSTSGAQVPIVLAVMDDACTKAWPEPSLFWGPRIALALDEINRDGARVIGMDWTQTTTITTTMGQIIARAGKGSKSGAELDELFSSFDLKLGESLSHSRAVVMAAPFNNSGPTTGAPELVLPTPQILYALPGAMDGDDAWQKAVGYVDFDSRTSVVSSQAPLILGPGTNGTPIIHGTSFAARLVEKTLGASWSAPNARLLELNPTPTQRPQVLGGAAQSAPQSAPRAPQVLGGSAVPLREDGTILINYALAAPRRSSSNRSSSKSLPPITFTSGAFPTISLERVVRGDFEKGLFRNAVVLVGGVWSGSNDFSYAPLPSPDSWTQPRLLAGVELQAHLLRTLLDGAPVREPDASSRWALAWALSTAALALGASLSWTRSALATGAVALVYGAASLQAFGNNMALPLSVPVGGMIASAILMGGYRVIGEERERKAILREWGRYQHPLIVEYLLHNRDARGGKGQQAHVTVLFADLKSFTKTVEHLAPSETIRVLNRYLALMQECVEEFNGYVDKYLGDGLLAQWGAPYPWDSTPQNREVRIERHEEAAVLACWAMLERAEALSRSLQDDGGHANSGKEGSEEKTFGLRLTLHSGPAIAGWVGSKEEENGKMEFTVIGDTVNVCSRLQESAKEMDADFLISQSTLEGARAIVQVGRSDEVEIRGRDQPLHVFEVVGIQQAELTQDSIQKRPNTSRQDGKYLPEQTTPTVREPPLIS